MKKKQILIFKTDRIGDFVNFSPCLKILKKSGISIYPDFLIDEGFNLNNGYFTNLYFINI